MATITKAAIDKVESAAALSQLETDLRAVTEYVKCKKDLARAVEYDHHDPDLARLVREAALAVPASISF